MTTKTSLPPLNQRPRLLSRFESSRSATTEANQIAEASQNTGVMGIKTQVVQRAPESSDIRFPFESQVEQFRGDVIGRGLRETGVPEQLSDLPKRVLPYNTPKHNTFFGSLSGAEAAALGMTPIQNKVNVADSQESEEVTESNELDATDATQTNEDTETTQEKITNGTNQESKPNGEQLSSDDLQKIEKIKKRDAEVRQHEQAHVSAGGQHIRGGIKYEHTQGPNGKRYVVSGEVNIDLSPESTPEATIAKMQRVRQAALAPAQPSAADRAAAAAATQVEQRARSEQVNQRKAEAQAQASKRTEAGKKAVKPETDNQSLIPQRPDQSKPKASEDPSQTIPSSGSVTQKRLQGYESYPMSSHESYPMSSHESYPMSSHESYRTCSGSQIS
jgi:hypothetical protein